MHHAAQQFSPTDDTLMVVPWLDPVVDSVGHDVRSRYAEYFWLNILGPTALWSLRRLVLGFDRYPLGYELDLNETASALGLSYSANTSGTFVRALQRCVLFGVSQPVPDGLAVRRRLPPVAARHLARMPAGLQQLHDTWRVREVSIDDLERGRVLAEAMVAAGDDRDVVERQLLALGVSPAAAVEVVAIVAAA
jgi:hypothetical protein